MAGRNFVAWSEASLSGRLCIQSCSPMHPGEVKNMFATKTREHDKILSEKGIEQGIEKGTKKGAFEKALETASVLKKAGVSMDLIIESTGLTKEDIDKL
jgi:predicted transposase/invertase (TIGR01784 family)